MAERKVGEVLQNEVKIEWKIPNFFSLSKKVDDCIYSDTFAFRGGTWYIRLWQNGETKHGSIGHVSIYLMREDMGSPIKLTFTLYLKSADGTLTELCKDTCTLARGNVPGRGQPKALQRSELIRKKAKLAPSDCLTVICLLKMDPESMKESKEVVEAATQTKSEHCIEKLSHDLNELLVSGDNSDVTVRVKGKEFRLHRNIMGVRTPVFHSMFQHEMREKATGTVLINDCEVDVFQAFIYYVYSARVDNLCTETVFDLFVIADKYQVDELKSACFDFIKRTLSVDTFCDVVSLALTYHEKELLQQATDFLANHTTEIMETVKWMNFMTQSPIRGNELLLKALKANKSKV